MRVKIKTTDNPINFMRRLGYRLHSENAGEQSFVRQLGTGDYPRFHAYIKESEGLFEINLHLDQRRPVYRGATAHGGEYDGPVVEEEAQRIEAF